MVANDKEMKTLLLNFFETKPEKKRTTIFATTDLYLTPRRGLTSEIKSKRRILSKWLIDSMQHGPAKVGKYKITIYRKIVPYKYIATKQEIKICRWMRISTYQKQ